MARRRRRLPGCSCSLFLCFFFGRTLFSCAADDEWKEVKAHFFSSFFFFFFFFFFEVDDVRCPWLGFPLFVGFSFAVSFFFSDADARGTGGE